MVLDKGLLNGCMYVTVFQANPETRRAQKKLAEEVTLLVHGGDSLSFDASVRFYCIILFYCIVIII